MLTPHSHIFLALLSQRAARAVLYSSARQPHNSPHAQACERAGRAAMSFVQPGSLQVIADSVGVSKLSTDAAKALAPDVEYRLREIIQAR